MKMRKKWIQMLAVFATILALPLTGKAIEGEGQEPLDLEADCTLTVQVGEGFRAATSFDLYKVAGLEKTAGIDGYRYVASEETLTGAEAVIERANELLMADGNAPADQTMQLASDAAELVMGGTPASGFLETREYAAAGEEVGTDVTFENLEVGLYLLIARGSQLTDPDDYFLETVKSDDSQDPSRTYVATMAYSEEEIYTFQAMLVTVPGLTPNADEAAGVERPWTYPWVYQVDVVLQGKYELSPRYASLEIAKELLSFKEGTAVNFLFSVEAEKDGRNVYSNVIPVGFDQPGANTSAVIDRIPAGADVVIREVYSGAVYQKEGTVTATARPNRGDAAGTVTSAATEDGIRISAIPAGDIRVGSADGEKVVNAGDTITVSFRNEYNNSGNDGGSVVNSFDRDEDGGWTLEKTYSDSNGIRTEKGSAGSPAVPDDSEGN